MPSTVTSQQEGCKFDSDPGLSSCVCVGSLLLPWSKDMHIRFLRHSKLSVDVSVAGPVINWRLDLSLPQDNCDSSSTQHPHDLVCKCLIYCKSYVVDGTLEWNISVLLAKMKLDLDLDSDLVTGHCWWGVIRVVSSANKIGKPNLWKPILVYLICNHLWIQIVLLVIV